ncbi:MAG: AbrB/MazE/SpoVT family DNA-binding domain-containing protein [Candidatus Bathyarchaeales archaeon]
MDKLKQFQNFPACSVYAFGRKVYRYYFCQSITQPNMENEVVVTRKGQTTIPVKLRRKYKIEKESRLEVVETAEGILLKPAKSIFDLAGVGSKYAKPEEMKKLLDEIREEEA